jgi:sodium/potassium-transporting ATPase subunit alpha
LLNAHLLLRAYLFLGLNSAALSMGAFFIYLFAQGWTWGTPLSWSSTLYKEATTVTFAGIVLAQVANVFACRSDRLSVVRLGWFTNPLILWGIATELILFALITYTPWGNDIFGTSPLPAWIFGPLVVGAFALLLAEEIRKSVANRHRNRRASGVTLSRS